MTPLDFPTFAACPNCGGDKGFESEPWGVCRYTGAPLTDWIPCEWCDATGEVETQSAGEERFDEDNG